LTANDQAARDLEFLSRQPDESVAMALKLLKHSTSQFRQDIFALSESRYKRQGYFVEFGATNGVELSNSHLLEREFGWRGILAEPARIWHDELRRNRNCDIETRCVWSRTGERVVFNQADYAELSTVARFSACDQYEAARKYGRSYTVETISLLDMLQKYGAPSSIDYLSMDTEGSEFEILSNFDFNKYQFGAITCEHNYAPVRQSIRRLLESHGYVRKFEDISQVDDWYVLGPP
jgi:FkbM family methyltransferase